MTARTGRILVADDEPSIRWLLERLLRQAGHAVVVVEDGPAALAAATAGDFDLAFVDIRMPGLDGLEALSRLRAEADALRARLDALVADGTAGSGQ
jgi:CheY-like chemotaxis protein